MKKILLTATVLMAIAGGGFALAQAPAPSDHAEHHPAQTGTTGGGMMGGGMMGGGMMGGGMCPMGGMGGLAMMGGSKTKVDVKKTDKGVSITLTAPDAAGAARLQKMAEAMRLMHEAMAQ